MTSIWGSLETSVDLAISLLAGYDKPLDERALILLAHSNFQQRIHMISSLCEFLSPDYPHLVNYSHVIKKIEAAQKSRNKYAHNAITIDEETNEVITNSYSSRGSLKLNTEVVKIEYIQEATAKIHIAMCSLHTLITQKDMKPVWERV